MNVTDVAWVASTSLVVVAVWAETMAELIRPDCWRRRLGDLGAGVALALASIPAAFVAATVARHAWGALDDTGPFSGAHPIVAFVVSFVVWDGLGWVDHWIGHRTRFGWFTHRPHHSGRHYDLTLALRQSPYPVAGILLLPVLALSGVSFDVAAVVVAASNTWQALLHMQARVQFPAWLSGIVMTPATHRLHHELGTVNLGPVLTVWDRVAGSFLPCPAEVPCGTRNVNHPAAALDRLTVAGS